MANQLAHDLMSTLWDETAETQKAVARLHEDIRTREERYKREGVDTSED